MKSIVQDVLARSAAVSEKTETAMVTQDAKTDAELQEVLEKLKTNIKIIGCGGGGCNTISRIAEEGVVGAELIATNTDAQHLLSIHAPRKVLLGKTTTRGLGAGALPQLGEEATRESEEDLKKILGDANIAFVSCGLGGGTGTGGTPIIARIAKEAGALTIAFVTLPFKGEGHIRMENAEIGLERLREVTDTVVVIPNDKLLELTPRLPLNQAFKVADEILMRAIKGLTETITRPGLVNLDYNDLKTIMKDAGVAVIGLGESKSTSSTDRAMEAMEEALNSPLLDVDINNASGVLVNVTGGNDMTISEAEKVAEEVQKKVNPSARILWGARIDPSLEHTIRVMIVATGVKSKQLLGKRTETEVKKQHGVELVR